MKPQQGIRIHLDEWLNLRNSLFIRNFEIHFKQDFRLLRMGDSHTRPW